MATSQRTQVALAPKKAPGKAGTAVSNIISNGFPIYCTKNLPFFKYDLRILAFFPNAAKPKEITKQLNEDFSEVERKKVQAKLLTILANREQDFFPGGVNSFVTDRAACLYSLDKYPILDPIGGHVFDMYTHEFGDIDLVQRAEKITVTITPCGENFQGTTNNYDNLFREFANIAVSHEAYQHNDLFVVANNGILIIEPEQLGFSADEAPTLPGSAKALPEIKKSVKIVEGPNYSPGIAPSVILSLDVSKHPIHMATFLLEKVKAVYMECGGRRAPRTFNLVEASRAPHVLNAIRNLEVLPTHRENARPFSIKGFGGAANREMIPDMRISVADFFKQQYKLQLRFPEGPTVRDNRGSLFPIEVLKVCPLQKVRKHQEFPEQTEKCTAAAASLPHKRKNQIFNALNGLNLETDVFMRKAGMCVTPEMIKIKSARAIFPPRIVYSGGQGENVQGGKWRLNRNRFYKAVRVDKWQVWANVEDRNLETVNAFIDEFRSRARNRGVELKEPEKLHLATDQMDEHMADAKKRGFQFIFMISEDYEDCHKRLKYLEVKYNLPTQNLTMRVARNAATKHQGVTFDNIIMKTNIKNRGLNHDIQYQQANLQNLVSHVDRLIIGIEMSHGATGADKDRSASIVGWSANCLQHPTQYTGNFLFVKARDTEPDLSPVFKQVLGRLQKYRKQPPKFVDIFMGGVSEGQLARVARSAVSKLLDTCSVLKFKPEVTLVAVSQDHVERFFRSDNDGQGNSIQQSVQPGLVIDREVVSPSRSEFFLVSCLPLQGTIKVPKYIVCVDTSGKRTMDDIETQAYGLAHLHQYNTATTSIPTPLYCARDYAQRGADVAPFIVKNDLPNMEFSLDLLNQVTYQRTPLDDVRMA